MKNQSLTQRIQGSPIHIVTIVSVVLVLLYTTAHAETVNVKDRGPVDLMPFTCTNTMSSFVNRVYFDKANSCMLILLNNTWDHYCEIDERTVASLISAGSIERVYIATIKDGPFDCRTHMPVRFSWAGIPACASISPAFETKAVPVGTKYSRFAMTDLNVPSFNHGGSTIAYHGDRVSPGAIRYTGSCPPRGEHHKYRWVVEALDTVGDVLAKGSATAAFPP
jgi:Phosphatidylethanolamine-binding protein